MASQLPGIASGSRTRGLVSGSAGGGSGRDRIDGRGTKKLIVAFHFYFSNQAGWKCDVCRKAGLEARRRCRWLKPKEDESGPPVWGRREVVLWTCPNSFVTGESQSLVEEFLLRRRLGNINLTELTARQVEAFAMLEREFLEEMKNGQQHTR